MPYGGTTPSQDKKIERCVAKLVAGGREKVSAIKICKASVLRGESFLDMTNRIQEQGFRCSCIKCGYAMTAGEGQHCKDIKCPKCGGQMRRASRPGPGQEGDSVKKVKFTENLSFNIQEGSINEEKHTVRVCALAPCISKNNRYYSPSVVESASGNLVGKKSFADHDQRDTKNLIGKIVGEEFENGRLYADIRISKARGIARDTWDKINDGTITDVSIAADGTTRRAKLGEQIVDEVVKLDIKSVDFVTEGGVEGAKVTKVFENIKDIPTIEELKEAKEKMLENIEQLQEQYPDLVAQILEPLQNELEEAKKAKEAAEFKLIEKELEEFKVTEVDKLDTTDGVKDVLKVRVEGKTKEEITASLKKEFEYIQTISEATKTEEEDKEAETKDIPPAEEKKEEANKPWTVARIMEDERIPDKHKDRAKNVFLYKGSKVMLEDLKSLGIEL